MDIIKALKENEKPFGLMSAEMQAKARKIGQNQFWKYLVSEDGEQVGWTDACRNFDEYRSLAFRLRPNYKEEPGIEMDFCEDCKFINPDTEEFCDEDSLKYATCKASKVPQYHRISRQLHDEEQLCSDMRVSDKCKLFIEGTEE